MSLRITEETNRCDFLPVTWDCNINGETAISTLRAQRDRSRPKVRLIPPADTTRVTWAAEAHCKTLRVVRVAKQRVAFVL